MWFMPPEPVPADLPPDPISAEERAAWLDRGADHLDIWPQTRFCRERSLRNCADRPGGGTRFGAPPGVWALPDAQSPAPPCRPPVEEALSPRPIPDSSP